MDKRTEQEFWMRRCLELAQNGLGQVSPNPMVGSVIVCNGKITGEGFHRSFGKAHAEVNAISSVRDKDALHASTIYVNLEPCAHQGKTPPCTDLIIKHRIREVVVGCLDPNPLVAGKGIRRLKEAGIKVSSGVMEKEAKELNRRFFTFHLKKRPYIILKWAQTPDGFIDAERREGSKAKAAWITSESLRPLVHKWRTEEDAIMVGTRTALKDNPMLTARDWAGRNPLRIVIDRDLSLPADLHLFDGSTPTLVVTARKTAGKPNLVFKSLNFEKDVLKLLMDELYKRNIQSLIVEGGAVTLDSFISKGLWDEARVLTGNKMFRKGIAAPHFPFDPVREECVGGDRISYYRNH